MSEKDTKLTQEQIDKIKAETEKIRAEMAITQQKAAIELAQLNTELETARAEATMKRIEVENMERAAAIEKSHDFYHNVYRFSTAVTAASVQDCMNRLLYWHRNDPGCPMEIIFSSPGGSVIDGLVLYDFIQELKSKGHKVITSTFGMAASMAGILLQAGDVRKMHKEAWLLIHEVSFGAGGKIGEIEDTVEWIKRIQERTLDIFAKRSAEAKTAGTATKALTKSELRKHWLRKDWWISSDEALAWGLVDEVV